MQVVVAAAAAWCAPLKEYTRLGANNVVEAVRVVAACGAERRAGLMAFTGQAWH